MQTVKEKALAWIQSMPDDCTIEDICEQLQMRDLVEQGMKDADEGRVFSHDEVKRSVSERLPLTGCIVTEFKQERT
jgi:predicted transcriptional regulator